MKQQIEHFLKGRVCFLLAKLKSMKHTEMLWLDMGQGLHEIVPPQLSLPHRLTDIYSGLQIVLLSCAF